MSTSDRKLHANHLSAVFKLSSIDPNSFRDTFMAYMAKEIESLSNYFTLQVRYNSLTPLCETFYIYAMARENYIIHGASFVSFWKDVLNFIFP